MDKRPKYKTKPIQVPEEPIKENLLCPWVRQIFPRYNNKSTAEPIKEKKIGKLYFKKLFIVSTLQKTWLWLREKKDKLQTERKYLIKDLHSEYIKNSQNSLRK